MPLIVTPGAADADSYPTIAMADAYHLARGNATWAGADAVKEPALRRATAWLNGAYKARWPGVRTFGRVQALDWPRVDAYDREGLYIFGSTIPPEIVAACCEAALRELVAPGSLSPDVTPGAATVLTQVGEIGWTPLRTNADVTDMAPTLLAVDRALSGILASGGQTVQLVRA